MDDLLPLIIDHWHHRNATFEDCLNETHGTVVAPPPVFTQLLIYLTHDGDIANNVIDTGSTKSKWHWTPAGVSEVATSFLHDKIFQSTQKWFDVPHYWLFVDGPDLLMTECYGPRHTHRVRGRYTPERSRLQIKSEWASDPTDYMPPSLKTPKGLYSAMYFET